MQAGWEESSQLGEDCSAARRGLASPRARRWPGAQGGFMHSGKGPWLIPAASVFQPC